jgi:DNA-directed RNA polymerase specialized sigma24 family protein
VFILRLVEGWDYEKIAEELKISVETARQRYSRADRQVRIE